MTTDSLACSPCSETLATIDWDWTATATRTGESRGRCAGLRYSRTGSRSLSHQSLPCPPPPPLSAANLTARLSVSPVQIPDKIPKNEYFSCHHCHQKVDASRYTGAPPPLSHSRPPATSSCSASSSFHSSSTAVSTSASSDAPRLPSPPPALSHFRPTPPIARSRSQSRSGAMGRGADLPHGMDEQRTCQSACSIAAAPPAPPQLAPAKRLPIPSSVRN